MNWLPLIRNIRIGLILITFITSGELFGEKASDDPNDRTTVHFGALSKEYFNTETNDISIGTQMFFMEIAKYIGMKSEFKILENKSKTIDALRNGELDVVFSNPIDYLDLDPLINPDFRYTALFSSNQDWRIYLLIPKSASISEIIQFQGKRLSMPKDNMLGRSYLEVFMAKAGLPAPEQFFSSIQHPINSNAAILDLFFDKADLAITNSVAYNLATELNPQLSKKLEILAISEPYIPYIIGINKQVPLTLPAKVDDILLHLEEKPRLRHILTLFSATNAVKLRPEQLEPLRVLKQEHEQLVGGNHN